MLLSIFIPQINLSLNSLGLEGAKALVDGGAFMGSLTAVDTRGNRIDGDGAKQLAAAVLGSSSMVIFGEVPIRELRADGMTNLNLSNLNLSSKDLGPTEAHVLAGLLPVSPSLTQVCPTLDVSSPAHCSHHTFVREPSLSYILPIPCVQIDLSSNMLLADQGGQAIAEAFTVTSPQ